MVTSTPFEQQVIGFDVYLLENTVPDEAVFSSVRGQVPTCLDVGGYECCIIRRDTEFMVIAIEAIDCTDRVCERVCLVQLWNLMSLSSQVDTIRLSIRTILKKPAPWP